MSARSRRKKRFRKKPRKRKPAQFGLFRYVPLTEPTALNCFDLRTLKVDEDGAGGDESNPGARKRVENLPIPEFSFCVRRLIERVLRKTLESRNVHFAYLTSHTAVKSFVDENKANDDAIGFLQVEAMLTSVSTAQYAFNAICPTNAVSGTELRVRIPDGTIVKCKVPGYARPGALFHVIVLTTKKANRNVRTYISPSTRISKMHTDELTSEPRL